MVERSDNWENLNFPIRNYLADRDDNQYAAVENVCSMHDLHATMLHQLGIQHEALSVKFQGLDAKLTGVEGAKVIHEILTQMWHGGPHRDF